MGNFTPVDLFDDGNDAEAKESVIPAMDIEAVTNKTEERDVKSEKLDYEREDIKRVSDPVHEETAENELTESDLAPEKEFVESQTDHRDPGYEELTKQIEDLKELFNRRIMHADYEDKIIDQMHAELLKYREDLYAQLIRPVLLDIIEVRDSIMRIAETYRKKPEGEQDIPNKMFGDYAYDLQDILEKNNVEIYREDNGDEFVPVRHRAIKKEITHDESMHGKIAESLSCGYSYDGRVISAEKVSVYFYEKENNKDDEREGNLNG